MEFRGYIRSGANARRTDIHQFELKDTKYRAELTLVSANFMGRVRNCNPRDCKKLNYDFMLYGSGTEITLVTLATVNCCSPAAIIQLAPIQTYLLNSNIRTVGSTPIIVLLKLCPRSPGDQL
jgi:hypothetical protein